MRDRKDIAADIASAAATSLEIEIARELSKPARVAKTTQRDQLLEAAYNLKTGNVPVQTNTGWLIKSKSSVAGTLISVRVGDFKLEKVGSQYIVNGNYIPELSGQLECEFYQASGKTYRVDMSLVGCTCAAGQVPGHSCWHMMACECWLDAGLQMERDGRKSVHLVSQERRGVHGVPRILPGQSHRGTGLAMSRRGIRSGISLRQRAR